MPGVTVPLIDGSSAPHSTSTNVLRRPKVRQKRMRLLRSHHDLVTPRNGSRAFYFAVFVVVFALVHPADGQLFTYQDDANALGPEMGSRDNLDAITGTFGTGNSLDSQSQGEPNPFFRLADDINHDGIPGSIVFVDPINGTLSTISDFSGSHQFNITFDSVAVVERSGLRSFDVGAVYWLYEKEEQPADLDSIAVQNTVNALRNAGRNSAAGRVRRQQVALSNNSSLPLHPRYCRFAADRQSDGLGFVYGYREIAARTQFGLEADGGILGKTSSHTETMNWVAGPQAGLVAFKRYKRLTFYAHGLLVTGLNDAEIEQSNSIGAELVPGATNRLLYAQPTNAVHAAAYDELAPAGVLWFEAGFQLTKNSSLRMAWSTTYIENILLAQDRVRFYLPDMGLADPGTQHVSLQSFFCGIEMTR